MKTIILLLTTVIGILFTDFVTAGQPRTPYNYTRDAGNYVFVMLTKWNSNLGKSTRQKLKESFNKHCKNKKFADAKAKSWCRQLEIKTRYSQPGMYHKNDPSNSGSGG